MKIVVYGTPAPQGSKNYFGQTKVNPATGKSRAIMVEQSDKLTPWRSDVITACRELQKPGAYGDLWNYEPFTGPVIVRMVFSFWRPASVTRTKRPFPSVAPDLSKLCRATEDALQAAGVLRDDCLIVEYTRLAKVYVNEDPEALDRAGAVILIGALVDSIPVEGTPPLGRMRRAA
jgi:Holliday junction resolvase RusA-like endonuclease